MNGNTLSIGTTNQTVADLSGAKISGTGSITATTGGIAAFGDIGAQLTAANGTVNLSSQSGYGNLSGAVSARDVSLSYMTANSSIAATGSITTNYSTLNGAISGAASLNMNNSNLTGVSTHTGVTNIGGYYSTISGNGALNNTSAVFINGNLGMNYSTTGAGATNRINDAASLSMNNGYWYLNESAAVTATTVEKIGALNIIGSNNTLSLVGNVGVLADSLSVQSGGKLFVDMGASGSLKFLTSPVAYNGAVVDGVLANRATTQGVLPVWATYDATVGLQTEHVVGALASAGTGIVRVTNLTNAAVTGPVSIGAAVFDTTDAVTGNGMLNTSKGLAFLQDNTLSIANVQMGNGSMLSNAGTNTISSNLIGNLTGTSVEKRGSGTIILTGTSSISDISINGGKLVVDGTLAGNVSNYSMGTGSLVIRGAGRVTGYMGNVTLENSNYTSTAGQSIGSVALTAGSNFTNNGYVSGTVDASSTVTGGTVINTSLGYIGTIYGHSGSSIVNYGSMRDVTTNGANLTNATTGDVSSINNSGTMSNSGSVSSVYNSGTMSNSGAITSSITNTGLVTNTGRVGEAVTIENGTAPSGALGVRVSNNAGAILNNSGTVIANSVDNSGQISNSGTFVLLANANGYTNGNSSGTYTQTAGKTTIDGTFVGDMLLKGGTLNGWGAIQGKVTVMNGASVLPGHSPGTMTIQDLTLENGSILNLDVSTTGGISDRLIIGGSFDAQIGSKISFNLTDTAGVASDFSSLNMTDYFSFSGASATNTNLFSNVTVLAQGTGKSLFALTLSNTGSVASVAAVPEPENYAMFLAGLGLLGLFTRRQRKLETV
jgi:fibronectin-binding autotransporter adhesin